MVILNCIAIDDERLSLDSTTQFIKQTPFLKLAGRFNNPLDGLSAIQEEQIDLIFLDIEMPEINGIEFAKIVNQNLSGKTPLIVFTSAFDSFALEGYKLNALDYLLKPFTYDDFLRVAHKALWQTNLRADRSATEADHLFVRVEYSLVRTDYKDILYIEGQKDYVKIHTRNSSKPILSLTSLKSLEEKLPSYRFMRVHRSHIISLDHITSITKSSLQIGSKVIPIGDQFKETILKFVESRTA